MMEAAKPDANSSASLWQQRHDIEAANVATGHEIEALHREKKSLLDKIQRINSKLQYLQKVVEDRQTNYNRIGRELRERGEINYKNLRIKKG